MKKLFVLAVVVSVFFISVFVLAQIVYTPKYEILNIVIRGTVINVDIYTSEKNDHKLIAINDELLDRYKDNKTHINFSYFDDKAVAKDYLKKQSDDSINESDKDKMFSHFIAMMTYNTITGLKQLSKNVNNNWQKIKQY